LDEVPYKLSGAVAKPAGITFRRLAFSYWIDNLGFITEGKLAAIFIKPSLGVSNWSVIYFINYTPTSSLALFITAPSVIRDDTDDMINHVVYNCCKAPDNGEPYNLPPELTDMSQTYL
jgi:hypothetical protein